MRIKYCNLAEFKSTESGNLDFTNRSKEVLVGPVSHYSIIDDSYAYVYHYIYPILKDIT